jgi:hypothetical protein
VAQPLVGDSEVDFWRHIRVQGDRLRGRSLRRACFFRCGRFRPLFGAVSFNLPVEARSRFTEAGIADGKFALRQSRSFLFPLLLFQTLQHFL